jgi:RND family efflux transporter MFP subunit
MRLLRGIGAAMDEAMDQEAALTIPAHADGDGQVMLAHAELARGHQSKAICTAPFSSGGRTVGAFTFERARDEPFDQTTVELCSAIASLVGPILELKRLEDRWLITKAWDSLRGQLSKLFGPKHLGRKLIVAALGSLATVLATATGEYRLTADATLEGIVQRQVIAPMEGYVATADVRAGDTVTKGQVLCTLDDRDLRLERMKWSSEVSSLQREYREALAHHDSIQLTIIKARMDKAGAELSLVEEKLARTQIRSPLDGYVVSGDLSQSLGAPVERGQALFEVAPLGGYRVVLEMDERDVAEVAADQSGTLALAGMPHRRLPFLIERVTPVSEIREGRNLFNVEARLEEVTHALRPGMQGVGKVHMGERLLIWQWTHSLVDWLRLWLWTWWP